MGKQRNSKEKSYSDEIIERIQKNSKEDCKVMSLRIPKILYEEFENKIKDSGVKSSKNAVIVEMIKKFCGD